MFRLSGLSRLSCPFYPFCPLHKSLKFAEIVLFLVTSVAVNLTKRACLDCPFPNCGAKYLVKLSNHLKDVHELDYIYRRKWLQEAKLQTNNLEIPGGIVRTQAFRFKTPSSILIMGPSDCGKTCFTESLLLDHLEELFVNPAPTIHYSYGAWQDGFQTMKGAGAQFHKGVPATFHLQKWFPKGGLLVLDDLMAEGGEGKELLDLFTKHSHHQNITVLYLCQYMFPPGK